MKGLKFFLNCKFLLLLFLLFSCISYGETKSFLAQDIQSIKVEGLKIKVFFKHKNSKNFQIEWDTSLSVKNKKTVLEIKDLTYESKNSWKDSHFFSKKEVVLKITGPSKPVSIFSGHLKVNFVKWKSPVFISSHVSKISGSDNESFWNLFSKESDLNLNKHNGSVDFKGFSLNAKLKNLSKTKSHFYFNDGSLKIIKGSGDIFFTTDKAKVDIKKFEGNLIGTTQNGFVSASLKPKEVVDVRSKDGELRFYFNKVGARFVAYTEKGKIYAPRHMHKVYSGKSTKVSGRLKGKRERAKVSLKTDVGSIYAY